MTSEPDAMSSSETQEGVDVPADKPQDSGGDRPEPNQGQPATQRSAAAVFLALVIAAVTIVAFLPTFQNGFVNWDDDVNITKNPHLQGPLFHSIKWAFRTTHQGPYQPLSWLTLILDYRLWGLNATGYHLTNLILHVAGVLVFFFVARRLIAAVFRSKVGSSFGFEIAACAATLLYAVHPLRVESVAWATERRDVLSGLFFFLALLSYLRARSPEEDSNHSGSLGAAFLLFVAASLSKATTVVFPVILLILDFYPLRRISGGVRNWFFRERREVWIEKLPFLIISILVGIQAVRGQMAAEALVGLSERGVVDRIAAALYNPAFYLYKTFVPLSLSPLYEWPVSFSPLAWPYLLGAAVLVALTALFIRFREAWPAGLALWIAYLVFLLPVVIPFQAGVQIAADRYTYLAGTTWGLLIGGLVAYCWLRVGSAAGRGISAVATGIVLALAVLTYQQTQVWRDTVTLWKHVLTVDPDSWNAYGGLGTEYRKQKHYDEALEMLQHAKELNPYSAKVHNNLGSVYADMGKPLEALPYYREALDINPNLAAAHYNLGSTLMTQTDRLPDAMDSLQRALELEPGLCAALHKLGDVHVLQAREHEKRGDSEKARNSYKKASTFYASAHRCNPQDTQASENAKQVRNKLEFMP